MGFFEDDRIKAKNVVHNEAWNLYQSFKALNYDNTTIQEYINLALQDASDSYRNNIYHAVLRIVGRSNEVSANGFSDNTNNE